MSNLKYNRDVSKVWKCTFFSVIIHIINVIFILFSNALLIYNKVKMWKIKLNVKLNVKKITTTVYGL